MSAYPAASKPTAAQVRVQRDRILASKVFSLSKRQSAFLDYVINTALEGRADRIKEFTLAVEVFGRDESFDPGVDSIVRVEASRLRAKLREYYADEGQADLVRIDVPKGHYVPVFDFAASEGSRPEEGVDKKQPTMRRSIRGRNRVLLAVLVVATGFLLFDRFFIDNETRPTPSAGSVGSQKTIAVLPFVNRSTNQSDVFFVDGIHDDLLTQLARIGSWKVISRTSVERFRGTTQSAPEIGAILGATNIIEGGVQRAGNRVHISVQLIDAAADNHLWAETYDRELTATNIFAIQSEIAAVVAEALQMSLSLEEQRRLATVPTVSLAAYEAFMRGKLGDLGGSAASWAEAQRHFQRAIELDPNFALAYVGLADSYYMQMWMGTLLDDALPKLEAAINKALELDDELGEAYAALGNLKRRQNDYPGAEAAFTRALGISPNSATTYYWYSRLLANLGRFEEALARARQGAELDPDSASIGVWVARRLVTLGRFTEALAAYERVIQIYPSRPDANRGIAAIRWAVFGRLGEAVPWYAKALFFDSDNPLSSGLPGLLFLDLGDEARAQDLIARGLELGPDAVWPNWHMQLLHAYRGDDAAAIEYGLKGLEIEEPSYSLVLPLLGNAYLRNGRYAEARALFDRYTPELLTEDAPTIDRSNYSAAVVLASVLFETAENERANMLLDRSLSFVITIPRLGTNGYGITDVQIYALQGRRDAALASLRGAVNEGWRFLWWYSLGRDVSLDGLQDDPAFQAIVEEIRSDMVVQLGQVRLMKANGDLFVL